MAFTKFNPVDVIVAVSYYLFSLFLTLSLSGIFKREYIIAGLVAGILLWLVFFRKKTEFSKPFLIFLILTPLLLTGLLLMRGCFNGDGIDYWLPWAREIVLQGRMPDFLLNTASGFASRMPLIPILYAGSFSLFGFNSWVIAFLPLFFAAATVFLIYRWLLEKGVEKSHLIFGILLILTNPLFLQYAGEPMQEPFILFFFTAFFYYAEKFLEKRGQIYFSLALLSAVLAAAKETGIFLFLPTLFLTVSLIKNKQLKWSHGYLLFLFFPLFLWFLRNYLIFDNPAFPFLNEIFKGRYYNFSLAPQQIFQSLHPFFENGILARIAEIPVSLLLFFFPLGILSFYGFFKKGKVQYILLFLIFLLAVLFLTPDPSNYIRFSMPFLAVFIVYAVIGITEIKSRIFLSLIFFFNLWGLFSTKLSVSESPFLFSIEKTLTIFKNISQFVYDYRLILAVILGLFFFFLISSRKQSAEYLIVLAAASYLIKTPSFDLGSWLNIWLPILGLIFIVLIWRWVIKLKEETLRKLVAAYFVMLLVFNGWGLFAVYSLAQRSFTFPNFAEAYGPLPEVAQEIEKLEGQSRDFYLYASSDGYFIWYHDFKTVTSRMSAFYVITNLEYRENMNAAEIHSLFKRSKIKYILNNPSSSSQLTPFYDKVRSRPDLFEPIFEKEGAYLWRVYF